MAISGTLTGDNAPYNSTIIKPQFDIIWLYIPLCTWTLYGIWTLKYIIELPKFLHAPENGVQNIELLNPDT